MSIIGYCGAVTYNKTHTQSPSTAPGAELEISSVMKAPGWDGEWELSANTPAFLPTMGVRIPRLTFY